MKSKESNKDQIYCDYYVDTLRELTDKTQNEFYTDTATQLINLRRKIDWLEKLLQEKDKEIESWHAYKRNIDEALNSGDGTYRP